MSSCDRRTFGKLTAGTLGGALNPSRLEAAKNDNGNQWTASGMKLGVSHQTPDMLTDMHLNYLKQMDVEYLEIRVPQAEIPYIDMVEYKKKVEDAGLKVFELMMPAAYRPKGFLLGTSERDKDIKLFQNFIKDLGKAGIDTTTYGWLTTGKAYQTGRTVTRGARVRHFELDKAKMLPNAYEREYSDEEMWDNFEYFIKRMLPVAEDAGVRLQLHPNDPPVTNQGVARIFRSTEAFKRAMEISNHSPYSGILFCVGTWAEMYGPDGEGEDIIKAIQELGTQGHIFQVHLRNVSSPLPNFYETFPDAGYVNLYKVAKALGEVRFNGIVVPDHVPSTFDSEAGPKAAEAYTFGYIRAMIQAVNTELGLE